jgi:hypothetical protein
MGQSNNRYCRLRACSSEQRDGRPYLIGSRGYEFISANLPLSRSLQYALGEIGICCWSRILRGHFCHDFIKRISHDLDELRVEMWHQLIPDDRLDIPASHASVGYERTTFQLRATAGGVATGPARHITPATAGMARTLNRLARLRLRPSPELEEDRLQRGSHGRGVTLGSLRSLCPVRPDGACTRFNA